MIDITKPLMCGDDVAQFWDDKGGITIAARVAGDLRLFHSLTSEHRAGTLPPLCNATPEPTITLAAAIARIEAEQGYSVNVPPPPEPDYEACRDALVKFYDTKEWGDEAGTPLDYSDKRNIRALIAAAKLLPPKVLA